MTTGRPSRARGRTRLVRAACAVAAFLAAADVAPSQAPRYAARHDTLRYTIDNPFRMYWLHGSDTVGPQQHEVSVESHVWGGSPSQPDVTVHNQLLDVSRRMQRHVYALSPNGYVRTIDRRRPGASQALDLLLPLPPMALRAGTSWTDTVSASGTDAAGPELYEVIRRYTVRRMLDTLGARRVADVDARGSIHYRFGFSVDAATHTTAWLDVAGPDTERYLFDTEAGRLIARQWDMHLVGQGVPPDAPDTVPAGLESVETIALSNTAATRFRLDPVPGADTSLTFIVQSQAIILSHTTARRATQIMTSLTRNDGMVGVATADVSGSRIAGYRATWADSTGLRTQSITVRGSALLFVRHGERDTSVAIPAGASWGIADYAMDDLLAPVLLAVPRDGASHAVAVFRPTSAHWDTGTATARTSGDFVVLALELSGDTRPETLVFTRDGDFLFGDNADAPGTRRVASDAKRFARLQAAMTAAGN